MSVMTLRLYLYSIVCLYILEILSQFLIHVLLGFTHVSFREPETIEEDLALVAQAMEMGIIHSRPSVRRSAGAVWHLVRS